MSIKIKERFTVDENGDVSEEDWKVIKDQVGQLLPGEYSNFICDSKKNATLPQLKYLFGVVLSMISKETGIETNELYRIFENKYAPKKIVHFEGEDHIVQDMKRCTSKEMGLIIEKIIRFADVELNIKIPTRDEVREPMAQEIYVDAYASQWVKPADRK